VCEGIQGGTASGDLAAEPSSAIVQEITAPASPSGSIHIELPGRAVVCVEHGVDAVLVRVVLVSRCTQLADCHPLVFNVIRDLTAL